MQTGSGFMSGEETELCNAYLSQAGLCTKNMSKTGMNIYIKSNETASCIF